VILFHSRTLAGVIICITIFFSCNAGPKNTVPESVSKPRKLFTLISPEPDYVCSFNDSVHYEIRPVKKDLKVDSVQLFIAGNKVATETASPLKFVQKSVFRKVGRQSLRLVVHYSDNLSQTLATQITVLSDIEPSILQYKQIRSLPHSADAYIQGLFWYKGFLYEGTGQPGHSKLMKIDPANGKILMERKIGDEFFGEGIARWKNSIYQLTYRQKVGFVYDLTTFEKIREFDLQTMEGWGLTTNDTALIVSDGSSVLYFYDPEYYSQTDQIDVCDNRGLDTQLNELEYTDGIIWANVYGEPYILKIDAKSGKVLGRLNLESLFPKGIPRDMDHVLNGIAYNPDNHSFFVTGKFWPVMYEIKISG
jgi:glutamine cyclotransferase